MSQLKSLIHLCFFHFHYYSWDVAHKGKIHARVSSFCVCEHSGVRPFILGTPKFLVIALWLGTSQTTAVVEGCLRLRFLFQRCRLTLKWQRREEYYHTRKLGVRKVFCSIKPPWTGRKASVVLDSYLIVGNQMLPEVVCFQGLKHLSVVWFSFREGKMELLRKLWLTVVEPQSGRTKKEWVSQSISSFSVKAVALEC